MTDGTEGFAPGDAVPTSALDNSHRAGDADRDRTVTALREHVVVGRLTLDEFSERVSNALAARTQSDLDTLLADLPARTALEPDARPRRARRWIVAVMGGATAKGRWRASGHTTAIALMGGCELDLRQAEVHGSEVVITAFSIMGGIHIVVPEGIEVDMMGFSIMGGRHMKIRDVPIIPGSPRVIVRAFPIMGGVQVESRPTRHSLGRTSGATDAALDDGARPTALSEAAVRVDRHLRQREVHLEARLDRQRDHAMRRDDRRRPAPAVPSPMPTEIIQSHSDRTVTILFSDIVDYSGMTERLGDRRSLALVTEHNRIVRTLLVEHGGREVKAQGDGFMIAFGGVARALRCAAAIQRSFREHTLAHPDQPIRVHLGLHTGEATEDGEDFLGHTVIVASRIADMAGAGEILVSSLSEQLVAGTGEFHFGEPQDVSLKGMSHRQRIAPLIWEH